MIKEAAILAIALLLASCTSEPPPGSKATTTLPTTSPAVSGSGASPSLTPATNAARVPAGLGSAELPFQLQRPPIQVLDAAWTCAPKCPGNVWADYLITFENRREVQADSAEFWVCNAHLLFDGHAQDSQVHQQDCWPVHVDRIIEPKSQRIKDSATFSALYIDDRYLFAAVQYVHFVDGVAFGQFDPRVKSNPNVSDEVR